MEGGRDLRCEKKKGLPQGKGGALPPWSPEKVVQAALLDTSVGLGERWMVWLGVRAFKAGPRLTASVTEWPVCPLSSLSLLL